MRFGIMSAMPAENSLLYQQMEISHTETSAQRTYAVGKWLEHEVVLVFSRWGKVAAAITTTHLITAYKVDAILFTGVAGSCVSHVKMGDIVIAESLVQHDMNALPFFSRHEIPLIGVSYLVINDFWKNLAVTASQTFVRNFFQDLDKDVLRSFDISFPKVYQGCIATGDKFFAKSEELAELQERLPSVLCVEMEGAAVAQVCHEYQVPCCIIRIISDNGNEASSSDFPKFVSAIASHYSLGILKEFLSLHASSVS